MSILKFSNIVMNGETGQYRANEEQMAWRGETGTTVAVAMQAVKRAEWFEGQIKIQYTDEEGNEAVMGLSGFTAGNYDAMWNHFKDTADVYIKKFKPQVAISAADFDAAMQGIEISADRIDEAKSGSVPKRSHEAEMMTKIEQVRDGIALAISGDKQALSAVFADKGCERIGRLRLVVGTVKLEVYHNDPRWLHLSNAAKSIEDVLKDIGAFQQWKPSEANDGMAKRQQMLEEFQALHGEGATYAASQPAAAPKGPGKLVTAGMNIPMGGVMDESGNRTGPGASAPAPMPAPAPEPEPARKSVSINPEPPKVAQPTVVESSSSDDDAGDWTREAPKPKTGMPGKGPGGGAADDREVADPTNLRAVPAGESVDPRLRPTLCNDADFIAWNQFQSYPDSLLEGWIWKESRWLRRWKRRYVVLKRGELCTYRARGDVAPTEKLSNVSNCRKGDGESGVRAKSFVVTEGKSSYYMICDDEAAKDAWISRISEALLGKK